MLLSRVIDHQETSYDLLGRFFPPQLEEKQKQQFLQDLFSQPTAFSFLPKSLKSSTQIDSKLSTFIQRASSSTQDAQALQHALHKKALHLSTQSPKTLKNWAQMMTSQEAIEELFRESFKHSSYFSGFSEEEKEALLVNLRDKRYVTQVKRGVKSALASISVNITTAVAIYFSLYLAWSLRTVCLIAGSCVFKQLNPDSFLYVAIGAPLVEEACFRVFFQTSVKRGLRLIQPIISLDEPTIQKIAILVTSILFGFAHFWNHLENPEEGLAHIVSTTVSSFFLGELYEKQGFLASFSSHSAFNASTFAVGYLFDL